MWTKAVILLIGFQVTNSNEILLEIHAFSLKKSHWKVVCKMAAMLTRSQYVKCVVSNVCIYVFAHHNSLNNLMPNLNQWHCKSHFIAMVRLEGHMSQIAKCDWANLWSITISFPHAFSLNLCISELCALTIWELNGKTNNYMAFDWKVYVHVYFVHTSHYVLMSSSWMI